MKLPVALGPVMASLACAAPFGPAIRARSEGAPAAAPAQALQLVPVPNTGPKAFGVGRNIAPKKNLALSWKTPDEESLVSVNMLMRHPSVVLEDIEHVAAVDCIGQRRVAVTFGDVDSFGEAVRDWSRLNDSFVLVTNHMGDCDTELERSFFVADTDTLASFESNLTIIANAEKRDVSSTADSTDISFSSVATATGAVDRRGISLDKKGLTIAYDWALQEGVTIIDEAGVSVRLNQAEVNNSVTYAGHLRWELLKGVTVFTIDVSKSLRQHANLTLDARAQFDRTWSWAAPGLAYSLIDIPGILQLGPSAGVTIGGGLTAMARGAVTLDVTASMPNGSAHLDLVRWDQSTAAGWEVERHMGWDAAGQARVTLTPSIDFKVEFAAKVLGGAVDLGAGVKAGSAFPVSVTATAAQSGSSSGGPVPYSNSTAGTTACDNGVEGKVGYDFSIAAFATQFYSVKLFELKDDLYKGCLGWFDV